MDIGIESSNTPIYCSVDTVTVEALLEGIPSGVGLDIAKNHSGVAVWEDGKLERHGFELIPYDKKDPHAEFRMRLDLKKHLSKILGGRYFNVIVIEDVYGGENFDTVRKLIALNTVIDELIFEGTVKVTKFYRWKEATWLKYFRKIYKVTGAPKAKIETQRILEYMCDSFYMENKDLSEADKKKIFFEDICDATAMLCSVAMYRREDRSGDKYKNLGIKDIKMYYIEDEDYCVGVNDDRIRLEQHIYVDPSFRNLEKKIISEVIDNPDSVLCMDLPVSRLGSFGIKHNFCYYESGCGCLLFYRKG